MPKKLIRFVSLALVICLLFEQPGFAQSLGTLDISGHIAALRNSLIQDKFRPLHLRSLGYDNIQNNFRLLLDKGDQLKNSTNSTELNELTKTLLNYFFVGITLPNDTFWVNLRPDSEGNIIDPYLAATDVGKILLEADLQLKKDTAKFTSPETPEGKKYWDKLYQKAGELLGYENITIPTLTRPWIVPGEIIIRETKDNGYIYKATLKVMLEEDYLKGAGWMVQGAGYNFKDERLKELNAYSSQLLRELIIPKLTKEVNTTKRYAPLRQVYYSLILARWFKVRFYGKGGLYSWLIDKKDLTGLTSKESWSKDTYFKAYQKSFKDGEYNIQQPVSTPFGQSIRSYFSGGIALGEMGILLSTSSPLKAGEKLANGETLVVGASSSINLPLGKHLIAYKTSPNSDPNNPYSGMEIRIEGITEEDSASPAEPVEKEPGVSSQKAPDPFSDHFSGEASSPAPASSPVTVQNDRAQETKQGRINLLIARIRGKFLDLSAERRIKGLVKLSQGAKIDSRQFGEYLALVIGTLSILPAAQERQAINQLLLTINNLEYYRHFENNPLVVAELKKQIPNIAQIGPLGLPLWKRMTEAQEIISDFEAVRPILDVMATMPESLEVQSAFQDLFRGKLNDDVRQRIISLSHNFPDKVAAEMLLFQLQDIEPGSIALSVEQLTYRGQDMAGEVVAIAERERYQSSSRVNKVIINAALREFVLSVEDSSLPERILRLLSSWEIKSILANPNLAAEKRKIMEEYCSKLLFSSVYVLDFVSVFSTEGLLKSMSSFPSGTNNRSYCLEELSKRKPDAHLIVPALVKVLESERERLQNISFEERQRSFPFYRQEVDVLAKLGTPPAVAVLEQGIRDDPYGLFGRAAMETIAENHLQVTEESAGLVTALMGVVFDSPGASHLALAALTTLKRDNPQLSAAIGPAKEDREFFMMYQNLPEEVRHLATDKEMIKALTNAASTDSKLINSGLEKIGYSRNLLSVLLLGAMEKDPKTKLGELQDEYSRFQGDYRSLLLVLFANAGNFFVPNPWSNNKEELRKRREEIESHMVSEEEFKVFLSKLSQDGLMRIKEFMFTHPAFFTFEELGIFFPETGETRKVMTEERGVKLEFWSEGIMSRHAARRRLAEIMSFVYNPESTAAMPEDAMLLPGSRAIVAIDKEGAIIGFIHYSTGGFISELIVLPQAQVGGLGSRLLKTAAYDSARLGRKEVKMNIADFSDLQRRPGESPRFPIDFYASFAPKNGYELIIGSSGWGSLWGNEPSRLIFPQAMVDAAAEAAAKPSKPIVSAFGGEEKAASSPAETQNLKLITQDIGRMTHDPRLTMQGNPPDGLCLTPDSLIYLADGTVKPLIELKPFTPTPKSLVWGFTNLRGSEGDMVLSLNEQTGKLEPHRVNALLDMGVKPVYRLRTQSGKELKTTLNHPYLVQGARCKVDGAGSNVQGAMCKVQGKPSTQHLSPSTSQCTKHLALSTSKWLKLKDLKAGDEIAVAAHSESTNSVTAISRNNQAAQEVFFRDAQDKVIYQGEDFSDTQQMNSQANNPATRIDRITQDIGKIRISGDKDKRLPFYQFVNFFVRCGGVNISDILNLMTFGSKKLAYASGAISVNQKLHRRLGGLGDKFFLIGQNSGIQNTGLNIFVGNGRKFFFDGFSIHPVSHSLKNNVRRSARSFDTGLAMLDVWFNANVFIKQFFIKHFISLQKQIYHTVGLLSRQFMALAIWKAKPLPCRLMALAMAAATGSRTIALWPIWKAKPLPCRLMALAIWKAKPLPYWLMALAIWKAKPLPYWLIGEAKAVEDNSTAIDSDLLWDKIVSIEPLGPMQVYDIEVEGTHNFVANGIVAHNTYSQSDQLPVSSDQEEQEEKGSVSFLEQTASSAVDGNHVTPSKEEIAKAKIVLENSVKKTTIGESFPEIVEYFNQKELEDLRIIIMGKALFNSFVKRVGYEIELNVLFVNTDKVKVSDLFRPEFKETIDKMFDREFAIIIPQSDEYIETIKAHLAHEIKHYFQEKEGLKTTSGVGLSRQEYFQLPHEKDAFREEMRYLKSKGYNFEETLKIIAGRSREIIEDWEREYFRKIWQDIIEAEQPSVSSPVEGKPASFPEKMLNPFSEARGSAADDTFTSEEGIEGQTTSSAMSGSTTSLKVIYKHKNFLALHGISSFSSTADDGSSLLKRGASWKEKLAAVLVYRPVIAASIINLNNYLPSHLWSSFGVILKDGEISDISSTDINTVAKTLKKRERKPGRKANVTPAVIANMIANISLEKVSWHMEMSVEEPVIAGVYIELPSKTEAMLSIGKVLEVPIRDIVAEVEKWGLPVYFLKEGQLYSTKGTKKDERIEIEDILGVDVQLNSDMLKEYKDKLTMLSTTPYKLVGIGLIDAFHRGMRDYIESTRGGDQEEKGKGSSFKGPEGRKIIIQISNPNFYYHYGVEDKQVYYEEEGKLFVDYQFRQPDEDGGKIITAVRKVNKHDAQKNRRYMRQKIDYLMQSGPFREEYEKIKEKLEEAKETLSSLNEDVEEIVYSEEEYKQLLGKFELLRKRVREIEGFFSRSAENIANLDLLSSYHNNQLLEVAFYGYGLALSARLMGEILVDEISDLIPQTISVKELQDVLDPWLDEEGNFRKDASIEELLLGKRVGEELISLYGVYNPENYVKDLLSIKKDLEKRLTEIKERISEVAIEIETINKIIAVKRSELEQLEKESDSLSRTQENLYSQKDILLNKRSIIDDRLRFLNPHSILLKLVRIAMSAFLKGERKQYLFNQRESLIAAIKDIDENLVNLGAKRELVNAERGKINRELEDLLNVSLPLENADRGEMIEKERIEETLLADGLCLTPDSLIYLADGTTKPLIELREGERVFSLNEQTQQLEPHRVNALLDMGIKPVYRITTASGKSLKTTLNHPYLVKVEGARCKVQSIRCKVQGAGCKVEGKPSTQHLALSTSKWLKLKDLKAGDEIAVANLTVPSQILDSFFNAAKGDKEISCLLNQRGVSFEEFNEFFCRKIGSFKDRIEGARFNSFRTMQRDYASAVEASLMPHNDMRTALPFNKKSLLFKGPDNLFAGDTRELGHTETSTSLSSTSTSDSGIGNLSSLRDQRYSSIASLILEAASSIVSPCEAHPESAGTWTEYPPSNSGSMITLNRFNISHPPISKDTISFLGSQEEKPTGYNILWDKIVSIEPLGPQQVYDIEVEGTHNFVAQGIVAHNTYSKDSIKVSKYQSVRDKDDRGQKPEDRSQRTEEAREKMDDGRWKEEESASSAVEGGKSGAISLEPIALALKQKLGLAGDELYDNAGYASDHPRIRRLRHLTSQLGKADIGLGDLLDIMEDWKRIIESGKDSPETSIYQNLYAGFTQELSKIWVTPFYILIAPPGLATIHDEVYAPDIPEGKVVEVINDGWLRAGELFRKPVVTVSGNPFIIARRELKKGNIEAAKKILDDLLIKQQYIEGSLPQELRVLALEVADKMRQAEERAKGKANGDNVSSSALAANSQNAQELGGIDLRALPLTVQIAPISSQSLYPPPRTLHPAQNLNLDSQWQEIEKMLDADIIPSTERIREYLFISCQSQDFAARIEKTLKVLADVLRLQENYCRPAEPPLKELLILLESDKPPQEFQLALSKIVVLPKEPANLAQ